MSIFEFGDQQGVRTRGTLSAPGATPGDVLTVGTSRGTVTPSPGGGSQPLVAFTFEDVRAIWDYGTQASLTDQGILYTAQSFFVGTAGDGITIVIQHQNVDGPLDIAFDGDKTITVTLARAGEPATVNTTTRDELVAALTDDANASALFTAVLVEPGTGDTIVDDGGGPLAGGVDPSGVNFLPLVAATEGSKLANMSLALSESFDAAANVVNPTAQKDDPAALGGQTWDLTGSADQVDSATGISFPLTTNANAAIADVGVGWPVAIIDSGVTLGLLFHDPGFIGPPSQGAAAVLFDLVTPAA